MKECAVKFELRNPSVSHRNYVTKHYTYGTNLVTLTVKTQCYHIQEQ